MPEKNLKILTINNKSEEKFLRNKTAYFDFKTNSAKSGLKLNKKEIEELIKNMRKTMTDAVGIGLSANQVGLDLQLFIAQISDEPLERGKDGKLIMPPMEKMTLYAVFNPKIVKTSKEKIVMEEGCLSVPGVYGEVERPEKVVIAGQNKNGDKIKIKASGLLARIFQHEIDHLNGILYIDKAINIHKAESKM